MNQARGVVEYYVKSRKAEDYRNMIVNSLYHPPYIEIDLEKSEEGALYLKHHFEERPLISEYIPNTMLGVEFLWGGPVHLETSEAAPADPGPDQPFSAQPGSSKDDKSERPEIKWQRVLYTMKDRRMTKKQLSNPVT